MYDAIINYIPQVLTLLACVLGLVSLNNFSTVKKQKQSSMLMIAVNGIVFFLLGFKLLANNNEAIINALLLWGFILAASGIMILWFLYSIDQVEDLDLLPLTMAFLSLGNASCSLAILISPFDILNDSTRLWFYTTIILGMNGTSLGIMCFFRRVKLDWNPPHPQLNRFVPTLIILGFIVQVILSIAGSLYGWSFFIAPIVAVIGWNLGIMQNSSSRRTDLRYLIPWLMFITCMSTAAAAFANGNLIVATITSVIAFMQFELWQLECRATKTSPWQLFLGRYVPMAPHKNVILPSDASAVVRLNKKFEPKDKSIPTNIQLTSIVSVGHLIDEAESIVIIPGEGILHDEALAHLRRFTELILDDAKLLHILIHPDAGHNSRQLVEEVVKLDFPDDVLIDDYEQAQLLINKAELALVIGASDIVNSQLTLTPPYTPYKLDKTRNVIILKRSLSHGLKKAKNSLFTQSHVAFLFGSPQSQLELINTEIEKRDAGLSAWNYIKPANNDETEFK